ncbi:copper resistance CopC family protein [Metabacillus fastidiosus]|uniref:copper resistance CopC family protein n=1 Tax=Metabacillus fastidiosus TaxID=1458 RepID=UPI003D28E13E
MIKKVLLFTFIIFVAFVNNAFAHTGLESSSPQNGEVITKELQQITLTFETKIEQNSTFNLQTSSGESIPIENIQLSGNQLVGNFSKPLENGDYQVEWKIIGVDGHPIDGKFSFSVSLPVAEAPVEEQEKPQTQPNVEKNTDQNTGTVNETEEKDAQLDNSQSNILIPVIIGVLVVIVIGGFFLVLRKKK